MNEENVKDLIGLLNLGVITARATHNDFINITIEDTYEIIDCLQELRNKLILEEHKNG